MSAFFGDLFHATYVFCNLYNKWTEKGVVQLAS